MKKLKNYLIDKKTNKYYINEPNTIPGSLSFYLWEPAGKKYEDLLDDELELDEELDDDEHV